MDPDSVFSEMDNVMQAAREVFDVRHKFERNESHEMPMALKETTRIDPTMLLAADDFLGNCKDCGKVLEMCVCSAMDDALLDTLIQQVSVPNLAALYQKAQDQGLVKPMYHYQSNS